jgi:hypothetical protein
MRLPVGVMRATLAIVLIAAGLALLQKANVGIASGVIIGVPFLIAIVAGDRPWFRSRKPDSRTVTKGLMMSPGSELTHLRTSSPRPSHHA